MKGLPRMIRMALFVAFGLYSRRRLYICALVLPAITCLVVNTCTAHDARSLFDILAHNEFEVIHHVSQLPMRVLSAANAIPRSKKIESIMVDPGQDYQDQHSGIDFSKPTTQLVFGGVAKHYVLVCYWVGGVTKAEHLMLIRCDDDRAVVVAKGVVHPPADTLVSLRERLKDGEYVPFDLESTYIVPAVPE